MTGTAALIAVFGVLGILLAVFLYLRREPGGPARFLLLALRVGTLTVVILLLLDFEVPGIDPTRPAPEGGMWVLLDPDLSMSVPDPAADRTLWESAVVRARDYAEAGARLALATAGEGGPEGADAAGLAARSPTYPSGDLAEAVRRLGEAGADSIVLVSSLREREGFVEALAAATPVPVRLERLGEPVANAGVAEFELPTRVPAGEPMEGSVSVFGEGGTGSDSVTVEIRAEGELRQVLALPLPEPGGVVRAPVRISAPADTGTVRYTGRVLLDGDLFSPDDERPQWVRVGASEGGVTLVSLRPDWEPRVLLPVLEAVTGLPAEGFLSLVDERFLALAAGPESGEPLSAEAVQREVGSSELLVIQAAYDSAFPDWLQEAASRHPRVLHLVGEGEEASVAGLELGPSRPGEWTAESDLPVSPLAPFLSGIPLGGLPPLGAARGIRGPEAGIVALEASGPGAGESEPVLVFVETEGGRRAVALADGFWRWGAREGEARRAYRGLWGGTSDWLLASGGGSNDLGVRPTAILQPRGEPLMWEMPLDANDLEVALRPATEVEGLPVEGGSVAPAPESVEGNAGGDATDAGAASAANVVYRSPLRPGEGGMALTPPADPGVYRWEVFAAAAEAGATPVSSGLLEVERWVPSLRTPPLDPPETWLEPSRLAAVDEEPAGRPLRTHPFPYLVLLGLLCAEWLGRRKLGLR